MAACNPCLRAESTALLVSHFFLCLCFVFVLCLVCGQFVVVMVVVVCVSVPFCAVYAVGIVSFVVQRFPFAASALSGPCGSVSSKFATGWSGTALNVLLVIPCLLMNVSACRSMVML